MRGASIVYEDIVRIRSYVYDGRMSETRHEPEGGTRQEAPTPIRILAQLGQDPGPVPLGFTVMTGADVTIGLLNSGDATGIDGRWCPVQGCTSINGWVTVETAHGYPGVTAYMDAPVHLARVINAEIDSWSR